MTYEDAILATRKTQCLKLNARNITDDEKTSSESRNRETIGTFPEIFVCVTETTQNRFGGRMKSLARTKIVGWIRGRCRSWATNETTRKFSHGIIRRELPEDTEMLKEEEEKRREERSHFKARRLVSETSKISPAETSRDRADVKGPFDLARANPTDGNTICILLETTRTCFIALGRFDQWYNRTASLKRERGSRTGLLVVAGRFVYLFRDE